MPLNFKRLKTMEKKILDRRTRTRQFEARNERTFTGALPKGRSKGKSVGFARRQGDCYPWKVKGRCTEGNGCSFRQYWFLLSQSQIADEQRWENFFDRQGGTKESSPAGERLQKPCKDQMEGTCTNPRCKIWHPLVCRSYKSQTGCKFGEKCSFLHEETDRQPNERSKKGGGKGQLHR